MDIALWLLVLLPLVVGLGLLVTGPRADRWAGPVAVTTATAALLLAILVGLGTPEISVPLLAGVPSGLAVDGLSAVMVITVATVSLAVLIYSVGDITDDAARARFFGLLLVFAAAMLVTVTATDLVVLLASWEVMGAMSYALIGYWFPDPDRARSATLAFLTTRTADLGMYLAAGAALAGGVGSLALADLPEASRPWLHVLSAGLILAAIGKSAQLPFSFWLSRAMAGPSPVSALLHSATMVAAGGYLLLRLDPLLVVTDWAGPVVAWIGVSTAVVMGAVALAQSDLKQLLAASTCSQIGFIVLAAGVGGVGGGTLQLVAHAATKSLLFLGAGAWLIALGTKDLAALRGVARRYPVVGATFTVGALTLAGLPPLSIWVAKDEVLAAAGAKSGALYVAGLAAAVLSALYAGKAVAAVWTSAPAGEHAFDTEQAGTRSVHLLMRIPLPALALAAMALGVLALPAVAEPVRTALGASGDPTPTGAQLAVSGALAVGATVLAIRWSRGHTLLGAKAPALLANWLNLERLVMRGVVAPITGLARTLAAIDDRVVDGGVRQLVAPTTGLARALAAFDDRVVDGGVRQVSAWGRAVSRVSTSWAEVGVDGAIRGIGSGTRWLGVLARRPQTGQLHHYYAQSAAVFAVMAIALVVVR